MINLNKCVLEIGANSGSDTQRLQLQYNLPVIAVEPTPEMVMELWSKYRKNQNIFIMPLAIDIERGYKNFNIAGSGDWGCSSFHEFNQDIHEKWINRPDFHFTDNFNVLCITGEDLIKTCGIEEIEYLWIDAQGNDFRVLKSFQDSISLVKKGKCEAAYSVELYKNTSNFYQDIELFLKEKGFKTKIVPDSLNKECDIHFER